MEIEEIFVQNHGLLTATDLRQKRINQYQINRLIGSGKILKLKRGLYKWAAVDSHEMADISKMVKNGVFCLFSAAFFQGLTTFVPPGHHLAVPDKSKIVLPDFPFIKLYFWDATPFQTGKTEIFLNGVPVQIYGPEKTLCDLVKYRKEVGFDLVKESFKNYLARPDRNIELVMQTARILNVKKIVQNHLELLV